MYFQEVYLEEVWTKIKAQRLIDNQYRQSRKKCIWSFAWTACIGSFATVARIQEKALLAEDMRPFSPYLPAIIVVAARSSEAASDRSGKHHGRTKWQTILHSWFAGSSARRNSRQVRSLRMSRAIGVVSSTHGHRVVSILYASLPSVHHLTIFPVLPHPVFINWLLSDHSRTLFINASSRKSIILLVTLFWCQNGLAELFAWTDGKKS